MATRGLMGGEIRVYVALGSNLGDRAAHMHHALLEMAHVARVEETSFLYESAPAYVVEQPDFLNAVCCLRTALSPPDLLAALETDRGADGAY